MVTLVEHDVAGIGTWSALDANGRVLRTWLTRYGGALAAQEYAGEHTHATPPTNLGRYRMCDLCNEPARVTRYACESLTASHVCDRCVSVEPTKRAPVYRTKVSARHQNRRVQSGARLK